MKIIRDMEFTVPKFIERQPKIIWTVTFKQMIFLLAVAGFLGILYLTLPRFLFFLVAFAMGAFSLAAVFIKIGGRPFPVVFYSFVRYTVGPKIYIWQRKAAAPMYLRKKVEIAPIKKEQVPGGVELKISEKSRLHEMGRRIETGV